MIENCANKLNSGKDYELEKKDMDINYLFLEPAEN